MTAVTETRQKKISTSSIGRRKDPAPPLPTTPPPKIPGGGGKYEELTRVECPFASENHQGREVLNVVVSLTPKQAFAKIFEDTFLADIYKNRKYDGYENVPWKKSEDGKESVRTMNYIANLPSRALGPSQSQITEIQALSSVTKDNELYVVDSVISNSAIPYADNFRIQVHYCITREKSRRSGVPQTRITAFAEVKFLKTTLFLVKGLIEKNAYEGIVNIFDDIESAMKEEAAPMAPSGSPPRKRIRTLTGAKKKEAGRGVGTGKYRSWTVLFVVTLLIGIGVMNGYLFFKMNKLQNLSFERYSLMSRVVQAPQEHLTAENAKTDEAKLKDLKIQEEILQRHFNEWRQRFEQVFESLNTTLSALEEIMELLPSYEAEIIGALSKDLVPAADEL